MGFWIDYDAFPKEVPFFVIMKGFVRFDGTKEVPVTAFQFFEAFRERKIVPVLPKPPPVPATDEEHGNTPKTPPVYGTDKAHETEGVMDVSERRPSPDSGNNGRHKHTNEIRHPHQNQRCSGQGEVKYSCEAHYLCAGRLDGVAASRTTGFATAVVIARAAYTDSYSHCGNDVLVLVVWAA